MSIVTRNHVFMFSTRSNTKQADLETGEIAKTKVLISLCSNTANLRLCFPHIQNADFLVMWLKFCDIQNIAVETWRNMPYKECLPKMLMG